MNSNRDRVTRFLFHLGKGLWKSVPVLGPIVEEVFFEQFREELTSRVSNMSESDLEHICESLPSVSIEELDELLNTATDEWRLFALHQFTLILGNLESFREVVSLELGDIQSKADMIPSIKELVSTVAAQLGNDTGVRQALVWIEKRRQDWIRRISRNQRRLLARIPKQYVPVDELWPACVELIPDCSYKEFRFRLHEFEWLNLVDRIRRSDTWCYRREVDAREVEYGSSGES